MLSRGRRFTIRCSTPDAVDVMTLVARDENTIDVVNHTPALELRFSDRALAEGVGVMSFSQGNDESHEDNATYDGVTRRVALDDTTPPFLVSAAVAQRAREDGAVDVRFVDSLGPLATLRRSGSKQVPLWILGRERVVDVDRYQSDEASLELVRDLGVILHIERDDELATDLLAIDSVFARAFLR